ncbi:DUF92 domain-containing protein [Gemmatimonas sp.]|uniref:DUF92 domain-containing protein n=3 Tax=Gemmatimonas sp. TaxID=1962908 RepID=UPI0025C451B5|nr:DUF92 domain-containing protein [Gemmatimonas sp.]MCA2988629.1 DUF92 domain-containing protein [Gemmatimonas sp.]MCA2996525.1 DUF92 domain-containing protein [Gemmatimonas sp.]MCE2954111.1 DUF92 domain-containing protein [Gemmatimonas sp.]
MLPSALLSDVLLGFGAAAVIVTVAWRAGTLARSGALAATAVGGVAMTAGRSWGLFLVLWFVTASLASRLGKRTKERATADVVAKGGQRDAAQVLANGGVFAACALASLLAAGIGDTAALMGAAALVAAGADTLATETGTWWRGRPWSLRTRGPVPVGTSGAVSLAGSAGMVLGAWTLAAAAAVMALIPPSAVLVVTAAGIAGAVADTVVGAFWQARRWCASCARETEQIVHRCGTPTQPWRGVHWLDNDLVNLLCTLVGALAVLLLGR